MRETIKIMALLLCIGIISIGMVSCSFAYSKKTDKMIAQCEQSLKQRDFEKCNSLIRDIKGTRKLTRKQYNKVSQVESQINELEKQIEQKQIVERNSRSTSRSSRLNDGMNSNDFGLSSTYSRFIGRYTIQGGDWDCPIEILSDGRVLLISHVIVTGEEIPKYIGDVNIISNNAFTIKNSPYNVSLCYNGTPIYVMRNGVERNIAWTSRDGLKASSLVFDIVENRAYRGVQEYRNRDIGEVEYVKFTR